MQNPEEDTEWNDILRRKGILPGKKEKEITEEEVTNIVEDVINSKTKSGGINLDKLSLDELEEFEDEEDEQVFLEYRRKRLQEIKNQMQRNKFGSVVEISGPDYVQEVNNAGKDIWVVLHLYKPGIPACKLINNFMNELAVKFQSTKFLKSISTNCVPNLPDSNLPAIFIYYEGEMKKQYAGSELGAQISKKKFEILLGETGAVETDLEDEDKSKLQDVLFNQLKYT